MLKDLTQKLENQYAGTDAEVNIENLHNHVEEFMDKITGDPDLHDVVIETQIIEPSTANNLVLSVNIGIDPIDTNALVDALKKSPDVEVI